MSLKNKTVVIIGGGAAGFFSAITCAEQHPDAHIIILEQSKHLLQKVKISGGGRCNVTHYCFDPRQLVKNYPRGEKQLLGPFMRFNPSHTFEWFDLRGVELKAEEDGRCFPVTDSSQTIIDCFLREAKRLGIDILTNTGVDALQQTDNGIWKVLLTNAAFLEADAVIVAAGSSLRIWKMLDNMGHSIIPPVPSLFTFNVKDDRISGLQGLSVENAVVHARGNEKLKTEGPILITHWGLSGPAILRLSAWGARGLADLQYRFSVVVNWCGSASTQEIKKQLQDYRTNLARKSVSNSPKFNIPRRLWERLVMHVLKWEQLNFADLSNHQIELLANELTVSVFTVTGKSTFKDEFVTAGGVDVDEVDFKTMQSKKFSGLYFAGEVLDIDAITGGFNFQSAWTTGFIAGNSVLAK